MTLFPPPDAFTWGLVAALAFARGADLLSTWLVTPHLTLEANPLMRGRRWRTVWWINLPLLGLPLVHHGLALALVVTSLLVAGTNLGHGALARGMGERRQIASQMAALERIGLAGALGMNSAGALLTCLGGAVVMAFTGGEASLAFWAALGVVLHGMAGLVHLNAAILRLHRRLRERRRAHRAAARRRAGLHPVPARRAR